ncbi:unnamed protein product, partial [Symbiodinium necroappetens]
AERTHHEKMPPSVKEILSSKRTSLLEEMAVEIQWPDKTKLLDRVANDPTDENSQELYATTLEEATSKHWLEGPFSPEEISERFESWLPVRRFAVVQTGAVDFVLSSGERLTGLVHPDWSKVEVLGVTLDVSGAQDGFIAVKNKRSRCDELEALLDEAIKARSVVPCRLPSFTGKLQFADGQIWGRAGRMALRDLRAFGFASRTSVSLDSIESDGKHHVIGLVELYGAILALRHWRKHLEGQRVLLFIDNWPALDALVKGDAAVPTWREILMVLENPLEVEPCYLWIARVASASNVADAPSRGSLKELAPWKLAVEHPKCPLSKVSLKSIVHAC